MSFFDDLLYNKKYLQGTPSVADFQLHVRGSFIVQSI